MTNNSYIINKFREFKNCSNEPKANQSIILLDKKAKQYCNKASLNISLYILFLT